MIWVCKENVDDKDEKETIWSKNVLCAAAIATLITFRHVGEQKVRSASKWLTELENRPYS